MGLVNPPQQNARANELATGDTADTLRDKRRWIQKEFEAGRINGKATRELHDLYSKRNMGKPQQQRTLAESLSDAAKEAKKRIDQVFGNHAAAGHSADHNEDNLTSSNHTPPHDTEDGTDRTTSSDIGDYDAAARRKALALGLELADYSTGGQGDSADVGNADEEEEAADEEEEVADEEEEEVAIKMEEDVDG